MVLVRKETAKKTIGRTGGSLFLRESRIRLHVPEGALSTDLHVTMSYLVSEQYVCIDDKPMQVAILELLPHGTKFKKEVTILEKLEHCFRLDSSDSRLSFHYCSRDSRKEGKFDFVESFDRVGSESKGRMNISRTNDAVVTRSLSFCEHCWIKERSSSVAGLSFFFRCREWNGLVNVDLKCIISCDCDKSRDKAITNEEKMGYTFGSIWSFNIYGSPDISSDRVRVEFEIVPPDISLKKGKVLEFEGTDVVEMLERKINVPISSNCPFDMEKEAKVIAVCTYHNKLKTKTNTLEFIVSADQQFQLSTRRKSQPPGNLLKKISFTVDLDNFLFADTTDKVDNTLKIQVAELVQSKWQRFLIYLGLDAKEIPNYKDKSDDNLVKAMLVLEDWEKKFGDAATKEVLVNACKKMDIILETV